MIRLTRLNSQPITVNSDLIKFVESNPDTVITLVNGDKILVHETDRKSTRLNSSHPSKSRMPSSA